MKAGQLRRKTRDKAGADEKEDQRIRLGHEKEDRDRLDS